MRPGKIQRGYQGLLIFWQSRISNDFPLDGDSRGRRLSTVLPWTS